MDLEIAGFTDREFTFEELTESINVVPNNYAFISNMGLFNPKPIATTYVRLEIDNWTLNLLPATERGAPGSKGSMAKRKVKLIEIPQVTHEDVITVAEIQNLRAFGSAAPKMLNELMNDKLITIAGKFHLTHEWYRINAMQGRILDADASVMIDVFDEFGVDQPVIAMGATGSKAAFCRTIKRWIERNLKGEFMTGIGCIPSPEFFEMMMLDADMKAAYNAAASANQLFLAMNPTITDRRVNFEYQGITFTEYPATASSPNGDGTFTERRFIPAGDAIFYPIGTKSSAKMWAAPGDFEESVNMPGQVLYAKEARDKWGRARDILAQSNVLPLWVRPQLLVRGSTSSDANDTNITDMAA